MRSLLAAFRFLTILPLPGRQGVDAVDLQGALLYFPLVGLAIGAVAAGCAWLLAPIFPPLVVGVLLTGLLLAASGGLHLDGLADMADGFFSSRPRERVLEIMRDSRIGPMGVIALVLVLLAKAGALASLEPAALGRAMLLMPLAGRCALLALMALLPYARPEGGLATLFYRGRTRLAAALALPLFAAVAWLVEGQAGLAVCGAALVTVLVLAWLCRRRIGGATGDTLGAGCELTETATALVLSLSLFHA